MKLHFGAGKNRLVGWENFGPELDIRRPLPWEPASVDYIFAEHLIEHVPFLDGVRFLDGCYRVLKQGGVLRLSFPDAARLSLLPHAELLEYHSMLERKGKLPPWATDDRMAMVRVCMRVMLTDWGHQSAWNHELAWCVLTVAGFDNLRLCEYGDSLSEELTGIDGHHKVAGDAAKFETTIVDAVRL